MNVSCHCPKETTALKRTVRWLHSRTPRSPGLVLQLHALPLQLLARLPLHLLPQPEQARLLLHQRTLRSCAFSMWAFVATTS